MADGWMGRGRGARGARRPGVGPRLRVGRDSPTPFPLALHAPLGRCGRAAQDPRGPAEGRQGSADARGAREVRLQGLPGRRLGARARSAGQEQPACWRLEVEVGEGDGKRRGGGRGRRLEGHDLLTGPGPPGSTLILYGLWGPLTPPGCCRDQPGGARQPPAHPRPQAALRRRRPRRPCAASSPCAPETQGTQAGWVWLCVLGRVFGPGLWGLGRAAGRSQRRGAARCGRCTTGTGNAPPPHKPRRPNHAPLTMRHW